MKIASLDLGSNTFLLFISKVKDNKIIKVLHDETKVIRLAEKVQATSLLQKSALQRAELCFKDYSKTIKSYGVDKVIAFATSAARDAKNSDQLIALGKKYQIPITIISGKQEAQLTKQGALYDLNNLGSNPVIIDVGGSSTEVIDNSFLQSFNMGSVRLQEACVKNDPPTEKDFLALQKFTDSCLKDFSNLQASCIVAVAGTPSTLACLINQKEFCFNSVHGKKISLQDLQNVFDKLSKMTLKQKQAVKAMPKKRADVILYGLFILLQILKKLKAKNFIVSATGVRYGIALTSNLQHTNKTCS